MTINRYIYIFWRLIWRLSSEVLKAMNVASNKTDFMQYKGSLQGS